MRCAWHFLGVTVPILSLLGLSLWGCDATDPDPDPTPPTVLSRLPANGATGASVGTVVTVVFSEEVIFGDGTSDAISVIQASQSLTGSVGYPIPNVMTFSPDGPFEPDTEYSVSLADAITDTAGNSLHQGQSWSFATASAPSGTLSETRIVQEIGRFSHDSMAGRGSATTDETNAAEYIRVRFLQLGLEPAVSEYLQSFLIPPERVDGQTDVSSQNVLGVLPGEGGLALEWVVVGAHYDHEGVQETTPGTTEIFNGADDNASGTALLLAIARALRERVLVGDLSGVPRRSVMFQAYGAEEIGLLGSSHYCANPVIAHSRTNGMLNFDMVGRLRNDELFVSGLWTSEGWAQLLENHNSQSLDIIDKQDCQSCSDYACFRRGEVPAIWFFTGFHSDYGTPRDDVDFIDGPGIVKIGDLALGTLIELIVRPERLNFGTVLP